MTAKIKYNEDMTQMRREMNEAVDRQMKRHSDPSDWEEILGIIIAEYENGNDYDVITISGKKIVSRRPQFVNKMEIPLGELRRMHRELQRPR